MKIRLFHSLPWDQSTPWGYFGETCFNILLAISYLIFNGPILMLFIFIALHFRAFYEMFRHSLQELDQSKGNGNKKRILIKLIRFHVSAKE